MSIYITLSSMVCLSAVMFSLAAQEPLNPREAMQRCGILEPKEYSFLTKERGCLIHKCGIPHYFTERNACLREQVREWQRQHSVDVNLKKMLLPQGNGGTVATTAGLQVRQDRKSIKRMKKQITEWENEIAAYIKLYRRNIKRTEKLRQVINSQCRTIAAGYISGVKSLQDGIRPVVDYKTKNLRTDSDDMAQLLHEMSTKQYSLWLKSYIIPVRHIFQELLTEAERADGIKSSLVRLRACMNGDSRKVQACDYGGDFAFGVCMYFIKVTESIPVGL